MKKLVLIIAACMPLLTFLNGCLTTEPEISPEEQEAVARKKVCLPFPVTVGGNQAEINTESAAVIREPVAADAEIECGVQNDDIITITFFPCDKDGIVIGGKKPSLIIIRDGSKSTLGSTNSGKKLSPGYYKMEVSAGDKTSRIIIQVK